MRTCFKTDSAGLRQSFSSYVDATKKSVDVNTGEVKVATKGTILRSVGIGSCVVVVAYNLRAKIGGMAHIMLPERAPQQSLEKTKYAFDGIEQLLNQMLEAVRRTPYGGADANEIEVCLVGAGNVLHKKEDTICEANIESVTGILKGKNIPVKVSALGGTKRKSVFLDVEDGSIFYIMGDEKKKTLWQAPPSTGSGW